MLIFAGMMASIGAGTRHIAIPPNSILRLDFAEGVTDSPDNSPFHSAGLFGGGVYLNRSNSLPRLIVRMNNIQYNDKVTGTATTLNETKYLSVRRYLGMEGAKFEPGKIYRVTIKFDQDHLGQNPNPEFVDLIVAVQVEEWIIETPIAELQGKE